MVDRGSGAEAAVELTERRWFSLLSAIRSLQTECETLLEASRLADVAWKRACGQLAQFEMLRDALEEEMSARPPVAAKPTRSGSRREADAEAPVHIRQQPHRADHQKLHILEKGRAFLSMACPMNCPIQAKTNRDTQITHIGASVLRLSASSENSMSTNKGRMPNANGTDNSA